jgi:hypothetical protein
MNRLLDLDKLVYETKSRERGKLATFELVLLKCHSQIVRYAKEHKSTECKFSVPFTILGCPPYDPKVLTNYLICHLSDNGLEVKYIKEENKIHISWKEEEIKRNYSKYLNRKSRIMRGKQSDIPMMLESDENDKHVSYQDFLRRC